MTEEKLKKLVAAMTASEQRVLKTTRLTEADQNVAKLLSETMGRALRAAPEAALLSMHTPVQRTMVLRLATELQIAALDAVLDVEEDVPVDPSTPLN